VEVWEGDGVCASAVLATWKFGFGSSPMLTLQAGTEG
jgi:hypothetical protein